MEDNTPELSPIEEQARAMGWLPKDEFEAAEKDPATWVPAEIFVAREPLFKKIDEQHKYTKTLKRELDTLRMTVEEQKAHTERVRATEFKRALEELKASRRQALAEDDHLKAEDIQEEIEAMKEAQKTTVPPTQTVEPPPAFVQWSQENEWYKLDTEMREFADATGIIEHQKGKSPEEVLKAVTEKVRKHFPEKFRNPMKDKAPGVETPTPGPGTKKGSTFKPTPEQRAIAKRFAETGVMTEEQYYKDLQAMDELE